MPREDTTQAGQSLALFDPGVIQTSRPTTPNVLRVWSFYEAYHPRARLDQKRRKLITDRLADGYTPDDLGMAIAGCHEDPWYQGDNDRGRAYCDLCLILRDADHVDRFIDLHRNPRRPGNVNGQAITRMAGGNEATLRAAMRLIAG